MVTNKPVTNIAFFLVFLLFLMCAVSAASFAGTSLYVAPEFRVTQLNGRNGSVFGLRSGITLYDRLCVGLAGYALSQSALESSYIEADGDGTFYRLGYIGAELEYFFRRQKSSGTSVRVFIGGGTVGFSELHDIPTYDFSHTYLIFEPGIAQEFSLNRALRLGIGVHYRLVADVETRFLNNQRINGPSFSLTLKYQWKEIN